MFEIKENISFAWFCHPIRSFLGNKGVTQICFILISPIFSLLFFTQSLVFAGNFEVGTVTLNNTFTTPSFTSVTFSNTYSTVPVVVILPTSDGNNPCSIRIRNVTTTGFEACQVEPDFEDGQHVAMTVHYLAIETGTTILPDGNTIYATTHSTQTVQCGLNVGCSAGWDTVTFPGVAATPAVVAQIQTMNNESGTPPSTPSRPFLEVAISNVTTTSCDIALERAEVASGSITINETIGIVVMEGGLSGSFLDPATGNTVVYEAISAQDAVQGWDNGCFTITFSQAYSTTPLVVASMNTRNGNNGGWLRRCDLTTSYVGLTVDEDRYNDSERNHILEDAGILVFSVDFNASGVPDNPSVAISEVAWMGTFAYPDDEWIELYNNTSSAIDLTGWTLEAADGVPSITLSGTIPANGYFLLERDDDWTIPNLTADQVYTGALDDGGEFLQLKNSSGTVIDMVNPDGGVWPAGSSYNFASMERLVTHNAGTDANWQTSDNTVRNAEAANGDFIRGNPKSRSSPSGSGRCLSFDGSDDYVSAPDTSTLDLSTAGTLEAWVYVESFKDNAVIACKADSLSDEAYCLRFGSGTDSRKIVFSVTDSSGSDSVTSSTELIVKTWYHVAGVFENTAATDDLKIYINGVLDNSADCSRDARNSSGFLRIGARYSTAADFFSGKIDEVKIWNTARTITQIQENLCKKQEGTETGLMVYYRFDRRAGIVCIDFSENHSDGLMNNMDPASDRVTSGVPLGDDVTVDFSSPSTLSLSSPAGDTLTIKDITGSPDGVVLYRADTAPSDVESPIGWRYFEENPHYFGTFFSGGTDPTYTAELDYTGGLFEVNEDNLILGFRKAGDRLWQDADAILDTTANTLTKTGMTGTEYILGHLVDPRNAIEYGGPTTTEYIAVTEVSSFDLGTHGTIEAWVKPNSFNDNSRIVFRGDSTIPGSCYELKFGTGANNNKVEFVITDSTGTSSTEQSWTTLTAGTWYHVAGVWDNDTTDGDGTRMELYINGIMEDNTGTVRTPRNGDSLNFGAQFTGTNCFDGVIDEIRIWSTDQTQTQIRDAMCRKLTGTETGLVGYWRFDRESSTDTSCPDYTGNGNTGTMTNFSNIGAARVCSEAPIGDACVHDFTGTAPSDFQATIYHVDGDFFRATGDGGTWSDATNPKSGLEVYRLDEPAVYPPDIASSPYPQSPNGLTPPSGWSSIDYTRYWGVFVTGGTNPTYQAYYSYANNPMVPDDDSVLGLAKRDDYCDRTWIDSGATLNTVSDTLIKAGETATEYVLGGTSAPLAITLLSVRAEPCGDGCIRISWETGSEIDLVGFYLFRAEKSSGPYMLISNLIPAGAPSQTQGAAYVFEDRGLDQGKEYYYRIEAVMEPQGSDFFGPFAASTTGGGIDFGSVDAEKDEEGPVSCYLDILWQ